MFKDNKGKMNKGFTMIEVLLSVFVNASITIAAVMFLLSAIKINKIAEKKIQTMEGISSALNIMEQDIRSTDEIIQSSNENKLVLYVKPDTVSYDIKDAKIRRTKNSFVQYLTEDVTGINLKFSYINEKLVQISLKANCTDYYNVRVCLRN